jgi:hypothetical protein
MGVLVVMANRRQEIGEVMVIDGVDDVPAIAPCTDQPERAEQPEVMRCRARAQIRRGGELLDGPVAAEQLDEHTESSRGRERLERLGEILRLVGREGSVDVAVL